MVYWSQSAVRKQSIPLALFAAYCDALIMSQNHNFLFASLDSKLPHTSRRVHIRRLYDILQLCIQRNDVVRASRAWAILVQCKEFRWDEHWATGLYILNGGGVSSENIPQRINYLRAMMLRDTDKALFSSLIQ